MKFYDDDMDDLFNKAGRDYPLKTEPKNWDAVRAALQPESDAAITQNRNGWRRLLPLLFLLLIPAVYVFIDKDNIKKDSVKTVAPAVTMTETANTNSTVTNEQKSNNKVENNTVENNTVENNRVKHHNVPGNNNGSENNSLPESINEIRSNNTIVRINTKTGAANETGYPMNEPVATIKEPAVTGVSRLSDNKPYFWNSIPSLNTQLNALNEPSEVISISTPLRSLNQSSGQTSVPNSDKKLKYRKGPYIGVIASPDVSTIKGQEVKGLGYSAGAILGYTLSKHWQIEGGALWSRKKYYTDGKYFDTKAARIPQNVKVFWLDGGCEMFEFPIVARYNFSAKRNTFFGSAGLTSYLMKKEDYDYKAQVNGYTYEGYRKYDRSGDHLFANLQLSAGYNFSLSSKLNIRIEPYLKAPLKNIGIGKMPITSTGLYFAITRDFH